MSTPDRDTVIAQNMGLAHSCARRFMGRGIEYEDLFQAACVGLVKAYDRFDSSRGFQFSTYAVPVILGEVKRIFRDGGSVKVSRQLKELSVKITAVSAELEIKLGRSPTVSETAKALDCKEELVAEAICASRVPLSLNTSEEGDKPMEIPDPTSEERWAELISLGGAIDSLTESERKLLAVRFVACLTQNAAAPVLNMSQVGVSRSERRILDKLRKLLRE